jgi:HrpA-like RNA helicase
MLPVEEILPELHAALAQRSEAVLVAPPGAGKTTRVAPGLLGEAWAAGAKIVLLSPRRIAARAAAARMASERGERVGETIGYRVRLDSKVGARTRIEVVTEGVFTRMILDDPELKGVAAVLFDEFHERSLEADLGLALARDAQAALRPDLKLVVMSATLDAARVAALLGDAPVVVSEGRMFPVALVHRPRDPRARLEDEVAAATRAALAAERGSALVFLPGVREIERTAEPSRTRRSRRRRPAGEKWCSPRRSRRPVSPSRACASSSIAAWRGGRASSRRWGCRGWRPCAPARRRSPSAPGAPAGSSPACAGGCGAKARRGRCRRSTGRRYSTRISPAWRSI